MKPKILWVEDSARLELRNLFGPVLFSGKYDFKLAEDVTTAIRYMQAQKYDALIVDIRLPPGADPAWQKLYQQAGADKVQAQLGLKLLGWLVGKDGRDYPSSPPNWVEEKRIAVFSVETHSEVQPTLDALGISIFKQKVAGLPDTILLQIIEQLLPPAISAN